MSRYGTAYPPREERGDARNLNGVLRREMGEVDWSIKQIVVGEHVHILAVCYCEECRAIRATAPSAEELAEIARDDAEDRSDHERGKAAAEANRRYRRSQLDASA